MDVQMPLGLLLLVLGLPNLYVGWSLSRGRGVPRLVAQDRVLTLVFTDDWLPQELRGTRAFEAGVRVTLGVAFALVGAACAVLAVANALS
jgi:hypothetical protein